MLVGLIYCLYRSLQGDMSVRKSAYQLVGPSVGWSKYQKEVKIMENGHFSTKFKRFFFTFLSLKGSLKQWKKGYYPSWPRKGLVGLLAENAKICPK